VRRLAAGALGGTAAVAAGAAAYYGIRALQQRYAAPTVRAALAEARTELGDRIATLREGMAEREADLRTALGMDPEAGGSPPDPDRTRALLDDPARWRAR
jgi:hypothetical protein